MDGEEVGKTSEGNERWREGWIGSGIRLDFV